MKVSLVLKSKNRKTGKIPTSITEQKSCPKSCAFYDKGCYAKTGYLKFHWDSMEHRSSSMSWEEFCAEIYSLKPNQLWRHNQAGDLPGIDEKIDEDKLALLVAANKGKRGFTYTHKPLTNINLKLITAAITNGFTINTSTESLEDADSSMELHLPTTTVIPENSPNRFFTKKGNKVIVCPAQTHDVTCKKCKLCQIADRSFIVAFKAHGVNKKYVSQITKI